MKLLVLAVIVAVMQAAPPVPRKASNNQTSQAAKDKQDTNYDQSNSAVETLSAKSPTPPHSDTETNPATERNADRTIIISESTPVSRKDGWDIAYVVFTGLLVGIGVFGVLYARKTLRAIEGQLQEIRKASEQTDKMIQHAQTQADAALAAANAAKTSADSIVNTERAWILAELGFYEGAGLKVWQEESIRQDKRVRRTHANVKLTCRNAGKTPAWIGEIFGLLEIVEACALVDGIPNRESLRSFGPLGPLGAGEEKSRVLQMSCPGYVRQNTDIYEFLSAYVLIEYRDAFGNDRKTSMGYSIPDHSNIFRQDGLGERNKNT